ncbi:efflux RND transporter periplasmic adaptor subunit [Sphingobacterium spiritivorum]|uniref:efflux RND transporter periplasmic adaptor subunit n=1 Tax=Sphingobacterium spiritivorum TaxID=258 RepID=UPI00191A60CC|nr:efflux RND transporter periplasmic adaptor subunit [Sphingobacterium spiritivorum]QQT26900.1 efflux RND transporter periplasmic adaptor subunit [Sphingobacterium spiritivorum]
MFYKYSTHKLGILVSLLSILFTACESKPKKEEAAAPAAAGKLPVDVIVAQEQELDQQEIFVGTLMPYREIAVVSETAQKITKVAFKDGSYVSQGAVLYTLNDSDIRSQIRKVDAELKFARLTKDRMTNLLKTETVKQQEYDEALMRLSSLEAQQEYLRTELAKTVICAPFSGKVGITKVHLGAYVSPGTLLVDLQDQSNLKINFRLPERYLPLIKTGTAIQFSTGLSEEQYNASITATEPELDAEGRSLQVQAIIRNNGEKFRAGQSVRVYFSTEQKGKTGVMIPTEALMPGEKGYNAFVIKGGVAKPVPVLVSNRTEAEAIITSGIQSGDSVVVSNMLRVADGTPVQAVVKK